MILEIEKLSVGYSGKAVIEDIELSLDKGEILSVIGPNGAGKSTYLKTVSGEIPPVSGRVVLFGKDQSSFSLKERAKTISLLLTDRIRPGYMTGREVVEAGRFPYTGNLGVLRPADREKVDEVIEMTGVSHLADRPFRKLSDGEKQRILFARALSQEPEILIMDEPMSYLDIKHKLEMLEILRNLRSSKSLTVIMALHEASFAGKISDKILMLKDKKVFGYGKSEEVFTEDNIKRLYDLSDEGWAFINSGIVLE